MQFTKHFTGVTAVLYLHESIHIFFAMLQGTIQKQVEKAVMMTISYGIPPKCVYSSLMVYCTYGRFSLLFDVIMQ